MIRKNYANCTNDAIQLYLLAGRRHQLNPNHDYEDKGFLIEQLSKIIEEQARMKFQQQINHQRQHAVPQEITGPGFSFTMPALSKADFNTGRNEPIQFAVQPFDSRYYEIIDEVADDADETSNIMSENQPEQAESKNLIPPPMHLNVNEIGTTDKILHRAQQKLAKTSQAQPDVMQKPLQVEFDNTTSLYIVALIAGLSCAFSTGVSFHIRLSLCMTLKFYLFCS